MLKKRLIGVVTVKSGWAVQSFGYGRYLPLGNPECLVENLDRWGADEILVLAIDRTLSGGGPDFELIARLARLGLETPLIYGGGIRTISDGVNVILSGAERLVIDALLHDDLSIVRDLSERLGAQAMVASLPLSIRNSQLEWLDYRNLAFSGVSDDVLSVIQSGVVSEVIVVDWQHEGYRNGFEENLVTRFPLQDIPLIAFGGISEPEQMIGLLKRPNVSATAVGNFLSYREHAIQKYKEALAGLPLRASTYESKSSLLADV